MPSVRSLEHRRAQRAVTSPRQGHLVVPLRLDLDLLKLRDELVAQLGVDLGQRRPDLARIHVGEVDELVHLSGTQDLLDCTEPHRVEPFVHL